METMTVNGRPCSCKWIVSSGELLRQYGDPFCRQHGDEDEWQRYQRSLRISQRELEERDQPCD